MLDVFDRCSDRSVYYRFFTMNRGAIPQTVDRLLRASAADGRVLLATSGDAVVGVAEYDVINPTTAEFAVMVDDQDQHNGIGTLLLEHLAAVARGNGIRWLVADVLAENGRMVNVLRSLGFAASWENGGSVRHVTLDIEPSDHAVAMVDERGAQR